MCSFRYDTCFKNTHCGKGVKSNLTAPLSLSLSSFCIVFVNELICQNVLVYHLGHSRLICEDAAPDEQDENEI